MGQTTSRTESHPSARVEIPDRGTIQGTAIKDISTGKSRAQRFAGIPYAQPPVGQMRWKRPQPLPTSFKYDSEGRKYEDFAPACPQPDNYALTNGVNVPKVVPKSFSEDCLYLNVWRPVDDETGQPLDSKLPVLFFIHGGWLQIGHAQYDASNLISRGGLKAIVVTPTYRLNVFGFLAHDALRQEDPDRLTGNYGFWDQRAALEWTLANIEHFGGDKHNITVGGLSAGAHSAHSQLLYEFDQCQTDSNYQPIIKRLFLQSNAAVWPAKTVEEAEDQLEELCSLLSIPAELEASEKIAKLRQIKDADLVTVIPKMHIHTFRATRDTPAKTFVKSDWTRAMMDGRFAKWCHQRGIRFLMGECKDEEWVYKYTNTPTDRHSLIRQVNNYYSYELTAKLLYYEGVRIPKKDKPSSNQLPPNVASPSPNSQSLYSILGVKTSATSAEIRAAYLDQVRRHHPDKIQQQQQQGGAVDDSALVEPVSSASSSSNDKIRELYQAYTTLIDDTLRSQYDKMLSSSLSASSSNRSQPRISAVVDIKLFLDETGTMRRYPCRCGSCYYIDEAQIDDQEEMIVGCSGCSEHIKVLTSSLGDDDELQAPIDTIFGFICAQSQVYTAQRILVHDLLQHLPTDQILRYQIRYRAKILDEILPEYKGVSHSFDDPIWWFNGLKPEEEETIRKWLNLYSRFIEGKDVGKEWYNQTQDEGIQHPTSDTEMPGDALDGKFLRVLKEDGQIQVSRDNDWIGGDDSENGLDSYVQIMIETRAQLAKSL